MATKKRTTKRGKELNSGKKLEPTKPLAVLADGSFGGNVSAKQ